MTEILELKKEIEQLKNGQRSQTVTANINNPWVIVLALLFVVGVLFNVGLSIYADKQAEQDNGIKANTELMQKMQEDSRENTDAVSKMASAVDQLVKDVDNSRRDIGQNTRDINLMRVDRFTDKDGQAFEKQLEDVRDEISDQARRDKEELRNWLRSLEDELDNMAQNVAEVKAKTRLLE